MAKAKKKATTKAKPAKKKTTPKAAAKKSARRSVVVPRVLTQDERARLLRCAFRAIVITQIAAS